MKQGYRKGLAKDLNGKILIKTMGYILDETCGFRYPGYAGDAVLPGDDGAVDQHAPPPFHDSRGKGDHEGHP